MARPALILDTTVLIDLLLHDPAAVLWFSVQPTATIGISVISVMEVLQGARDKREMETFGRFLAQFNHLHVLYQDSHWAVRQFRAFWLSHQIGIADCLIGALAARLALPLYTVNLKDFKPLPDIEAIRPY